MRETIRSETDSKPMAGVDVAGDIHDTLSAEQAMEAKSIKQESISRLNERRHSALMDAGPSQEGEEPHAGNRRVSPHNTTSEKYPPADGANVKRIATPLELKNDAAEQKDVDAANDPMRIKDEGDQRKSNTQETEGDNIERSQRTISEYVSSNQNNNTNKLNNVTNAVDSMSGVG